LNEVMVNLTGSATLPDGTTIALQAPVTVQISAPSPTPPVTLVPEGGDLQKAIDSHLAGGILQLAAGASYPGPFNLRRRIPGSPPLVIQGPPLPPGRLQPEALPSLPKLLAPPNVPAVRTEPGANNYTLSGLEILPVEATGLTMDLVTLGDGSSAQNSLANLPAQISIDRCYIHGQPQGTCKRGIALNCAQAAITGCLFNEFKNPGQDCQAICGWNGPGLYLIEDNELSAAGECVMFGGVDPFIIGLVPTGITLRRNHFILPLSWRGSGFQVKNLLELKNAQNVTIDGNLFEQCWGAAQDGQAILFTVSGSRAGMTVANIIVTNNVICHAAGAFLIGNNNPAQLADPRGIRIENNLLFDINGPAWGGDGHAIEAGRVSDLSIIGNTILQTGTLLYGTNGPITGLIFNNNLASHGSYGIYSVLGGSGTPGLVAGFPGYQLAGNTIIGGAVDPYPPGTLTPASVEAVLPNRRAGHWQAVGTTSGIDPAALSAALSMPLPGGE
jgi:hypothetical protein